MLQVFHEPIQTVSLQNDWELIFWSDQFQWRFSVEVLLFLQHGTVATSSETSVGTQPGGSVTSRTASETPQVPSSTSHHHTGAKFRHGLLQLMIHTIDPLHDGQYAGRPKIYLFICGGGRCRFALFCYVGVVSLWFIDYKFRCVLVSWVVRE